MSHPLIIETINMNSNMFIQLKNNKYFAIIYCALYNHGGGPRCFCQTPSNLEIAKAIVAETGRIPSDQIDLELSFFTHVVMNYVSNYGLESIDRVYLDGSQWIIYEFLSQFLKVDNNYISPDAILFGECELSDKEAMCSLGSPLRVNEPATVYKCHEALVSINIHNMPRLGESVKNDYRQLIYLYHNALNKGESIVFGD